MKTFFRLFIGLAVVLSLGGCAEKVYVEVPKPYAVPTACTVPNTRCGTLAGTPIEQLNVALECIVNLRQNIKVCQ